MNMGPQVSIGLPVRNGERFLPRALDCLIAQTLDNFEVVISDNASTDATSEICAEYARRDPRIRWFRQDENLGAAKNYNFVFREARAPYFAWAAHDDERHPDNLRRCVEYLETVLPSVVLAYPRSAFIDADCVLTLPNRPDHPSIHGSNCQSPRAQR